MNDMLKILGYVLRNEFSLKVIAVVNDTFNFLGYVLRDALDPELKR
ncbi:MAG: hypothetical protein IJR43_06145 [Synergistaceae bacterium]|nr:hypothetical protein [Synergistaceae bacterium]MBQ9628818.1 hypothetical protein [Synergistaceae bacterium]MBR0250544.1 hypothetical protein [Synergistaceae bacterium]